MKMATNNSTGGYERRQKQKVCAFSMGSERYSLIGNLINYEK